MGNFIIAWGEVEVNGKSMRLISKGQRSQGRPFADPFLITDWGERRYLVNESKVQTFCNLVNTHLEPRGSRTGTTYLREGDWSKGTSERPKLPVEYHRYLIKQFIKAQVTEIINVEKLDGLPINDAKTYTIRIDAGSKDGIFAGLGFRFLDPTKARVAILSNAIEVIEVTEDSCVAKVDVWTTTLPGPEVGWVVTTGPS